MSAEGCGLLPCDIVLPAPVVNRDHPSPLPRIRLEPPDASHARAFLRAVAASRRLHAGYVAPPDTPASYRNWLSRIADGTHAGHLLFDEDGRLAGAVNLSGITRGAVQGAWIGYYAFSGHEGRGIVRAGLRQVVPLAFRAYRLHRLEAHVQPANAASRRLVQTMGFRLEGLSPRLLKIGGRWRDHERWALCADEWRAPRARHRREG